MSVEAGVSRETRARRVTVIGTGTGVGKTYVGVALVAALAQRGVRVCGLKPIESGGRVVGYLGYLSRIDRLQSLERVYLRRQHQAFGAVTIGMVLAAFILAAGLAYWLTRRVRALVHTTNALIRGDYGGDVQSLAAEVLSERHVVSRRGASKRGVEPESRDAHPFEAATSAMRFLKLDRLDEVLGEVRREIYAAEQGGSDATELYRRVTALTERFSQEITRSFRELFPPPPARGPLYEVAPRFAFALIDGLALHALHAGESAEVPAVLDTLKSLAALIFPGGSR